MRKVIKTSMCNQRNYSLKDKVAGVSNDCSFPKMGKVLQIMENSMAAMRITVYILGLKMTYEFPLAVQDIVPPPLSCNDEPSANKGYRYDNNHLRKELDV